MLVVEPHKPEKICASQIGNHFPKKFEQKNPTSLEPKAAQRETDKGRPTPRQNTMESKGPWHLHFRTLRPLMRHRRPCFAKRFAAGGKPWQILGTKRTFV